MKKWTPEEKKKWIYNGSLILFSGIFLFSAFMLVKTLVEYQNGVNTYNDVQSIFASEVTKATTKATAKATTKAAAKTTTKTAADTTAIAERTEETSDKTSEMSTVEPVVDYSDHEHEASLDFMHTNFDYLLIPEYEFNFEALQAVNPEVYGWVVIAGTNINYPFTQGTDNKKYLRKTVLGEDNNAGCVFLDYRNENPFEEVNTVLYGHNQKNGRMLHELVNYDSLTYYQEHPYVKIYLPDGSMRLYQIFSSYEDSTVAPYQLYFRDGEVAAFLEECAEKSNVSFVTGKTFTEEDRIITFCTCTDEANEYRRVVHAFLLK